MLVKEKREIKVSKNVICISEEKIYVYESENEKNINEYGYGEVINKGINVNLLV